MADPGDGGFDESEPTREALLHAMLESVNVMTGVLELLDDDYRYVMANRAAAAFFGREDGGLAGLSCREIGVPERQIEARMKTLRACHAASEPTLVEYPSRSLDGRDYWFMGAYSPIAGRRKLLSFMVIDITAQRHAQQIAEAQTLRLTLALEATDLGIWEYDIKTNRVDWDDRTRTLFGVDKDTQVTFATYVSHVHPDDLPGVEGIYKAALSGADNGRYGFEHRTNGDDGSLRWLRSAGRTIFDADGKAVRVLGTVQDITEQVVTRERQALLVAELNHRVKNNLAAVQAIASNTLRSSGDDIHVFRQAFQGRLQSLARGHELLTQSNWGTPPLAEVLRIATEPYDTSSVIIESTPDTISLHPELAVNLVMVLHELATNAAKYGALTSETGEVRINAALEAGSLVLDWRERGGPAVSNPIRTGFGTRLKDSALRRFGGAVKSEFAPDGLRCHISVPLGDAVIVNAPTTSGSNTR